MKVLATILLITGLTDLSEFVFGANTINPKIMMPTWDSAISYAESDDDSLDSLGEEYEKALLPDTRGFEGWYSGRCFDLIQPDEPFNGLLAVHTVGDRLKIFALQNKNYPADVFDEISDKEETMILDAIDRYSDNLSYISEMDGSLMSERPYERNPDYMLQYRVRERPSMGRFIMSFYVVGTQTGITARCYYNKRVR